jgi:hypothetical protein
MSTQATNPLEFHLTIDGDERAELINLLERALGETRVEVHRTHTPSFREQVLGEEAVIRRLLEKLRRLGP